MIENWLPVPGFPDYEVSDHGNVRSLPRTIFYESRGYVTWAGKTLTPKLNSVGRLQVGLRRNSGERSELQVHRLVLEAFVGPAPDGTECCHNNGVCTDNRLENLRWDTKSSNMQDRVKHGQDPNARKTHCKHGHEFTLENTYYCPRGYRRCRTCRSTQW